MKCGHINKQGLRGFPDKWTLGTKFSACRDAVADMHLNLCSQIRCLIRQCHGYLVMGHFGHLFPTFPAMDELMRCISDSQAFW